MLGAGVGVTAVSRSGKAPSTGEEWTGRVKWVQGDARDPATYASALEGALGAVSCVGAFGSNAQMLDICGQANVAAIEACKEAGVPRFAFVSAHDFRFPGPVLRGYVEGKRAAERALADRYGRDGLALRPGMVYGARRVEGLGVSLPLQLVGRPLEAVLGGPLRGVAQGLMGVPTLGAAFVPPVPVDKVGRAAAMFVLDPSVEGGVRDVWGIRDSA